MAKRKREPSEDRDERLIKEGRGQGEGIAYQPWLKIQDVPSEGKVSRDRGWKTGRVHHFMSTLELHYFYNTEPSVKVLDVREQYPLLPKERTVEIATELGLEKSHPGVKNFGKPIVMTTDFYLKVDFGNGPKYIARTVKPVTKLGRTELEKLRIEYQYWKELKVDWGLVTDLDISKTIAGNVDWLHDAYRLDKSEYLDTTMVSYLEAKLFEMFTTGDDSIAKTGTRADVNLGLEPGTSILILKHLLANGVWSTDLTQRIRTSSPLEIWIGDRSKLGGASDERTGS